MKSNFFLLLIILLISCSQKTGDSKNSEVSYNNNIDSEQYSYSLTKDLTINSSLSLPIFDVDSIEDYTWSGAPFGDYIFIKDYECNYYFSRKIADITPGILTEGIYPSTQYNDAKFFIYNDIIRWNHNENKIYIGTLVKEKDKPIVDSLIKSYKRVCPVLMYTPNDRIKEDFDKFKEIESQKAKFKSNTPKDSLIYDANVINELGRKQKAIKEKKGTLNKYSKSR